MRRFLGFIWPEVPWSSLCDFGLVETPDTVPSFVCICDSFLKNDVEIDSTYL
jgi:hypothetical protein